MDKGKRIPGIGPMGSKSHTVGTRRSPSSSHKKKRRKSETLIFRKKSSKQLNRPMQKFQHTGLKAGHTVQMAKSSVSETKSPLLKPGQSFDCSKETSPHFRNLDQQKEEVITQKNEDLGINILKLENSPKQNKEQGRLLEKNEERKNSNKTRPVSSPVLGSLVDGKGRMINDGSGAALDAKEITLLTPSCEAQAGNTEEKSATTKPTKGKTKKVLSNVHRQHSVNVTEKDRTSVLGNSEKTPSQNELDVYNFMPSPEKRAAHPESRKRSLQTSHKKVKRSRVKHGSDSATGENVPSEGSSLKDLDNPSRDGSRSVVSTSSSTPQPSSVSSISKVCQPHSQTNH